jgi:TonB family protein
MNTHNSDPEPPGARISEPSLTSTVGLVHWLIRRASRNAPTELADRLEEEWLADLASRTSPASRLRFALGCCWAVRVISTEHCSAAVVVATPVAGARLAMTHFEGDPDFFARNSLTVVVVVAFHIAVFYALMTGLGFSVVQLIPSTFQTHILPNPQPASAPPPLPHPTIADQRLRVPPPEFPQSSFPDDSVGAVSQPAIDSLLSSATTAPIHEVSRVIGGPGRGFPTTDDFYPSAAKRLEEQGVATVRVCVDASGRLTSAPTTVRSSGYPRLDEGAVQLAKAGSGHYRASTEDGRAVNSCYPFRIRFQLRN